jgi:hypothetical protein
MEKVDNSAPLENMMSKLRSTILPVVWFSLLTLTMPVQAQWIKLALPDTPRNADGTPNLTAPAPRSSDGKVDLSGIWHLDGAAALRRSITAAERSGPVRLTWLMRDEQEIPLTPQGAALYSSRIAELGKGSPSSHCLPHAVPDAMLFRPWKIVQNPRVTLILFEVFNHYRQIFTDGRGVLTDNPQPTWFGYSVGHWEKDSLVVETNGFNDKSWMDDAGLPHSENLQVVERFVRPNFGHLQVTVRIDDAEYYTRPWEIDIPLALMPDTELMEDICENERDSEHIVGK